MLVGCSFYSTLFKVGIPYVQFYGAFIVQCTRPHLRQQRQQKMKKADLSKSPSHSLLSRKQLITTLQNVRDRRNGSCGT
ncbi:hypothetical protein T12_6107 [Trichinella patagoniensis]|uniref:Uncharacterized protein n=1 Tax=Trichinella patagoniensis TaxID=990121 RepID=A0A0V0YY82_9BILA|nr:hypothetical protein T12_6107 [Trichinella patagoniensis]